MAVATSTALGVMAVGSLASAGAAIYQATKKPDIPDVPGLPPPVEDVDVAGRRRYAKEQLRQRRGRASTILGSQTLGQAGTGKATLG